MPRLRLVKYEDRYAGWIGESCWRARARSFLKRMEHKHNRRVAKRSIEQEVQDVRGSES